jgi:hypothetical protein
VCVCVCVCVCVLCDKVKRRCDYHQQTHSDVFFASNHPRDEPFCGFCICGYRFEVRLMPKRAPAVRPMGGVVISEISFYLTPKVYCQSSV